MTALIKFNFELYKSRTLRILTKMGPVCFLNPNRSGAFFSARPTSLQGPNIDRKAPFNVLDPSDLKTDKR